MIQEDLPEWQRQGMPAFFDAYPNPSGIKPIWYNILVRLDPVEKRSAGGIFLPDQTLQMQQGAETHCTLVAVGGMAFTDASGQTIEDAPKPGDRIIIAKYSGQPPKAGDVDNLYRLCTDKDVVAVMSK